MRVDQYVTGFAPHDAIGNHTLQVRRALREAGFESEIWAEAIHPPLGREARPYTEDVRGGTDRLLLYQCSTNSALAPWLAARAEGGERLLCQYHNITPAKYFERWHRGTARAMSQARAELALLAPRVELALPVSCFNQEELLAAGYHRTVVCPLLVDLDEYHGPPDPKTLDHLRRRRDRSGSQWLFVGRFAPNKCQHDVIGAFAAYRRLIDPAARLALVGGATHPRYRWALERLAYQLQLGDSVEFVDGLGSSQLLAYWSVADVFVCLSEHEGFCVPVLEAMELGVPVVAYAAAAVPETLDRAGLLVEDKSPVAVAEAVEKVCRPGARRQQLIAAGRARAASFALPLTSARLVEALASCTLER
jgi:glycosyltransferase involved in cell wall biosynthesis